MLKKQEEIEAAKKQESTDASISNGISESLSNRQVGMKFKREEDEPEDDVDWEEAPTGGKCR